MRIGQQQAGGDVDRTVWDERLLPEVLETTVQSLERLTGTRFLSPQWSVRERMDRRSSTVFQLRVQSNTGQSAVVYYKVFEPRRFDGWTEGREAIGRFIPLTNSLNSLLAGTGVQAAPVLAADSEHLTVVSLAMEGNPLKQAYRDRDRELLDSTLIAIGATCRRIEAITRTWNQKPEPIALIMVERHLHRYRDVFSSVPSGERLLRGLAEQSLATPDSTAFAHGDLSKGNILCGLANVGIIDFSWVSRPVGYDLARIAFRTYAEPRVRTSMKLKLIGKLFEGYGPGGLAVDPTWRLVRTLTMTSFLSRPGVSSAVLHTRVKHQLRTLLQEGDPLLWGR